MTTPFSLSADTPINWVRGEVTIADLTAMVASLYTSVSPKAMQEVVSFNSIKDDVTPRVLAAHIKAVGGANYPNVFNGNESIKKLRDAVRIGNVTSYVFLSGTLPGSVALLPAAPSLKVTPGNLSLSVAFLDTALNGGSLLGHYLFVDAMMGLGIQPVGGLIQAGSPYNYTGLVNGRPYTLYMSTVTDAGEGPLSAGVAGTPFITITMDTTHTKADSQISVTNKQNIRELMQATNQYVSTLTNYMAPVFDIAAPPSPLTEGNSGVTVFNFPVVKTGYMGVQHSVNWTITGSGGSPANSSDFAAMTGTLVFAPGETVKNIAVQVLGDTTSEPNEGFTVTLSAPSVGTIGTAAASSTILNDESPFPTITSGTTATVAENQPLAFTMVCDDAGATFDIAGGVDAALFEVSGATLRFLGNTTRNFEAPVDTGHNNVYDVVYRATNAFGAVTKPLAVTVTDVLDTPSFAIAAAAAANEGDSGTTAFIFPVTRSGYTSAAHTVDWAVTGTGAHPASASDFVGGVFPSGTLNFASGDTVKNISVPVQGDTTIEFNETFTVTLVNPSNNGTIPTPTASSTINNDEASGLLTVNGALPDAQWGVAYSQNLTILNGSGSYSYTAQPGGLVGSVVSTTLTEAGTPV